MNFLCYYFHCTHSLTTMVDRPIINHINHYWRIHCVCINFLSFGSSTVGGHYLEMGRAGSAALGRGFPANFSHCPFQLVVPTHTHHTHHTHTHTHTHTHRQTDTHTHTHRHTHTTCVHVYVIYHSVCTSVNSLYARNQGFMLEDRNRKKP